METRLAALKESVMADYLAASKVEMKVYETVDKMAYEKVDKKVLPMVLLTAACWVVVKEYATEKEKVGEKESLWVAESAFERVESKVQRTVSEKVAP